MARPINKLTALEVEAKTEPGRHSDGGGLYLLVDGKGRRSWVFMYKWRGRQREAGLGSASKGFVTLKAAREKAAEGRALIADGRDPLGGPIRPTTERRRARVSGAARLRLSSVVLSFPAQSARIWRRPFSGSSATIREGVGQ
jgi:hypothetical protein